jgi:hypothetical protein
MRAGEKGPARERVRVGEHRAPLGQLARFENSQNVKTS